MSWTTCRVQTSLWSDEYKLEWFKDNVRIDPVKEVINLKNFEFVQTFLIPIYFNLSCFGGLVTKKKFESQFRKFKFLFVVVDRFIKLR